MEDNRAVHASVWSPLLVLVYTATTVALVLLHLVSVLLVALLVDTLGTVQQGIRRIKCV